MPTDRKTLKRVLRLLERSYGRRPWRSWGRAVDVLVETILSQNTSNANSSAGYRQLRRRFRSWSAAADAPVEQVEDCIRVSGLAKIKAPRIQAILRQIRDGRGNDENKRHVSPIRATQRRMPSGAISLEFLRQWDPQEASDYLLSFDGVGPKTAACVLLFSFNMPVFPVDTHIHRIAIRLGLAGEKASAVDVQKTLTPCIAPADRYAMHVLLVEHGRKTCKAANPLCEWCRLLNMCQFGQDRNARQQAIAT